MKKAFKKSAKFAAYSFLYARPILTRRLSISVMKPSQWQAYRDFILHDNRNYYRQMAPSWFEAFKTTTDAEFSPRLVQHFLRYDKQHASALGILNLVVRRVGSANIIGILNVYADDCGNRRVAYYMSRDARQQGFAKEAVSAVYDVLEKFEHKQVSYAEVPPDYAASRTLLLGLGFKQVGCRIGRSDPPGHAHVVRFRR